MSANVFRMLHRIAGVLVFSLYAVVASAQSLTWLGPIGANSRAYGISSSGSVIVGVAFANEEGDGRAFRWTAGGGMEDLGSLGGRFSIATAVSGDGSTVVGGAETAFGVWKAFRWTATGGMQSLGTPSDLWSRALAVSADGSVVVGWSDYDHRPFRWTVREGMRSLGSLGGVHGEARGVSADGSVVVGWSDIDRWGPARAFRWTAQEGMRDLGKLGGEESWANSVSGDGRVVVGNSQTDDGTVHAFRWTEQTGMQDLGTLGGESHAYAASYDGSVVVGASDTGFGYLCAFRWTAQRGMENLNGLYAHLLTPGSWLHTATAVSSNGRIITGWGFNANRWRYEAFLLVDVPPSGRILTGNISLQDYCGDLAKVPITIQVRKDGLVLRSAIVRADELGNFSLVELPPGTYDLWFKAPHWLGVVVRDVVVSGDVWGVHVALTNGDIDGDNEVSLQDFGRLIAAFGSVSGEEYWNPNADLDGDGEVTLMDFSILVRNMGAIGDE